MEKGIEPREIFDWAHELPSLPCSFSGSPQKSTATDLELKKYWQDARNRLVGSVPHNGVKPVSVAENIIKKTCSGPLNMGYLCTDRQIANLNGSGTALRVVDLGGNVESFSYGDLTAKSNSFANVLAHLGVERQDTVVSILGRIPELYVSCLGSLKYEAVFCPLFAAFGPDPIKTRMNLGHTKVLITTGKLYEKKFGCPFDALAKMVPSLEHVLIIGTEYLHIERASPLGIQPGYQVNPEGRSALWIHDFHSLMRDAPTLVDPPSTDAETPALIHFTSGTTGTPKGAVHVHEAIVGHFDTAQSTLGLRQDDVFWCTADPGWVTGTSYGIFAPLTVGATVIVTEREFDPAFWYHTLQNQNVTVWYTAPTALRMLMKAGDDLVKNYDLSRLRTIASVGEPLNAEVVHWGKRVLGKEIHDTWWQTETGCIMIASRANEHVKPGSMGRAVHGVEAAIVKAYDPESEESGLVFIAGPEEEGELALKVGWPSLFRSYLGDPLRYSRSFREGWYLTGDLVRRNQEGFFYFVGRRDDVIKSSGHLIGPFEIESILMEHDGIAEAGVIGIPDATLGEVIKAFISLKKGFTPSETLRRSVIAHARHRLGAAVSPREIDFVDSLPKTRSGKVMRRLLKARELGLPEGDTSSLESM